MAGSLKPLEPKLNAVVRMYDRLVGGATTFDSHRQSVDDERSIGTRVDRPAHCHLRTGVEHDTAKDLALSSWVLGDALNIRASHKKRHGTAAHLDPQPLRELRVHPHCSVNATSITVHLANDVSEPRVTHSARRRDSAALRVKTAFGHIEYSTAPLN